MIQRSELLADGCLLPAEPVSTRINLKTTHEKGGFQGGPTGPLGGAHSEGLAP